MDPKDWLAVLLCQPCTASSRSPEQAPQPWGTKMESMVSRNTLATGQAWDGMRKFLHRVGSPTGTGIRATSTFTCSAAQRPHSFCVLCRKKYYRGGRHPKLELNPAQIHPGIQIPWGCDKSSSRRTGGERSTGSSEPS